MGATLPHAAPPSGAPPHWPSELRRQGRRGSAGGGVGRPFRQKSNRRAASERAAPADASSPTCSRRQVPQQTGRKAERGEAGGGGATGPVAQSRTRSRLAGADLANVNNRRRRRVTWRGVPKSSPLRPSAPRREVTRARGMGKRRPRTDEANSTLLRSCHGRERCKEASRSGRESGGMRHRSRAVTGVFPRERRWKGGAKTEAAKANPAGHAPRGRRRLGLCLRPPRPRARKTAPFRAQRRFGRSAAAAMRRAVSFRSDAAQKHRGELAE